jgi:hypothetical protein
VPPLTELSRSLQAGEVGPSVVQIFVTGYASPEKDRATAGEPQLQHSSGPASSRTPTATSSQHVVENATH